MGSDIGNLITSSLWTIFLTFKPTGALITNLDPNLLRRAFNPIAMGPVSDAF